MEDGDQIDAHLGQVCLFFIFSTPSPLMFVFTLGGRLFLILPLGVCLSKTRIYPTVAPWMVCINGVLDTYTMPLYYVCFLYNFLWNQIRYTIEWGIMLAYDP
jgi:hypothetical protein